MPANIRPWHCPAEARAERHARTFVGKQRPAIDPQVLRLRDEGYNALQIASLLRMPAIDVRLQLATHSQTVTTTREVKR
jgi:hypothetical protein